MAMAEQWIGKNVEGSGRCLMRYYPRIYLEGLRDWLDATKDLSQDNRSPGRDLSPGPPEYETGVFTIQPRRSVLSFKLFSVYTRSDSKSINFKRQGFSKHNAGWMIT
jgi:hypothetical protein